VEFYLVVKIVSSRLLIDEMLLLKYCKKKNPINIILQVAALAPLHPGKMLKSVIATKYHHLPLQN
jgi:hypothetical protein